MLAFAAPIRQQGMDALCGATTLGHIHRFELTAKGSPFLIIMDVAPRQAVRG